MANLTLLLHYTYINFLIYYIYFFFLIKIEFKLFHIFVCNNIDPLLILYNLFKMT